MTTQRLFVIDAMAMAFRNFHAFGARPLTTSKGLPVSAVFGSSQFLLKLIEDEQPDYLVIATDSREPTFRHALYEQYKANRSEMPEDLAAQLPHLFRLFEALGCKLLKQPGMEADDLIGSLVQQVGSSDLKSYIVSGDKDFMQLVNDNTFLYAPKKGEPAKIIDRQGVYEKFACTPEEVIEVLALIGDASDNVPGVPGIGEKSASALIAKYHTLENIYEHLEEISNPRQREALRANREQAFLSRKLVTIDTNVQLPFSLQEMRCKTNSKEQYQHLYELFKELEFRSLTEKMQKLLNTASQFAATPPDPIESTSAAATTATNKANTNYRLVQDQESLNQLLNALDVAQLFAFDTETTGLDKINSRPIGISFSTAEGAAWYIPLCAEHGQKLPMPQILTSIRPPLLHASKLKIAHNLKFDLQMLRNIGVEIGGPIADTMIASYVLDASSREHGLDALALKKLALQKIPTSDLIGKKGEISMLDVDISQLTEYACEDADCTLRLWHKLEPELGALKVDGVFRDIEMPLVPILARMEQDGVFIDAAVLAEQSIKLGGLLQTLTSQIYELAGEEFNINSTKQLGQILFEKLKIHEQLQISRLKKTKSGYSTDVSVLEKLSAHPLPKALLDYRTLTKLKNTYIDALPTLINATTQRLHTNFLQTGTATGRLSSNDPNLQNIPIRSPLGRDIRKAFRAQDPESVIISADYSQVELRLLAHIAKESALAEAFRNGADIHTATAARIFGVPPEQVDSELRSRAKAINFGIIYGMGPMRLARETNVSMQEAKLFIEKYFASYPQIERYIDESIAKARELGYTTTISGRRRPLPEINSRDQMVLANAENIAVNSPVQGSAADLIKLAMIRINKRLANEQLNAKMLLQVHDELVFECHKLAVEPVVAMIKTEMENAMQLDVPLLVDVGVGNNWLEAH